MTQQGAEQRPPPRCVSPPPPRAPHGAHELVLITSRGVVAQGLSSVTAVWFPWHK